MRVLVIDDDSAFLGMVTAALEEDGHAVVTASDGRHGLLRADDGQPDAIILDLVMANGDGQWFAHAYAKRPGRHAPIIVVSGYPGKRPKNIENAVAFLPKPFEIDRLMAVLHGLPGSLPAV